MTEICLKYMKLGTGSASLNMATLPDNAYVPINYTASDAFAKGHIEGIDNELGLIKGGSLVQSGAGVDPVATFVVPDYIGQIFVDTTNSGVWVAKSLVAGDWIDTKVIAALNDLGDVVITAAVDGDILMFDGTNWINTKEIGPGHTRNGVLTATMLGGINGDVFPGDNVSPFKGLRGISIGGSLNEVYGDDSIAMINGESFGDLSVAMGGKSGGTRSVALPTSLAGGTNALSGGGDAQAGGSAAFAFGGLSTMTGIGTPAVTIANAGADLVITIASEDLTTFFPGGQTVRLFDFTGGTYNPATGALLDASSLNLLVDSSLLNLGNTELTVLAVNHNATGAKFNYDSFGLHSMAFGEGVTAKGNHSFSFGDTLNSWGDNSFAFGDGANVGETGVLMSSLEHALSFGKETKALHSFSHAVGLEAQTRNKYERVFAAGRFSALEWSQERIFLLNQTVAVAAGVTPMYTDKLADTPGTDEIATFSDHSYLVIGHVLGSTDAAGTVKSAAWKIEAVFKNDTGVLTQVGATTTTLIATSDAGVFAAPVFAISGTKIRINVDDDISATTSLDWAARVTVVELAAR
jgi:hypothetical protein